VDKLRAIDYEFSGGTVFLHAVHTPYDDNGSPVEKHSENHSSPGIVWKTARSEVAHGG
jgi:hypothetical protein